MKKSKGPKTTEEIVKASIKGANKDQKDLVEKAKKQTVEEIYKERMDEIGGMQPEVKEMIDEVIKAAHARGVEEERARILEGIPDEEDVLKKQDNAINLMFVGFNRCRAQVIKLIKNHD